MYTKKSGFFWQIKQPIVRTGCRVLYKRNVKNLCRVWGAGLFKQETERRPTAVGNIFGSSVNRSLFTVFPCEFLCILHEFCTISAVFLREVGPQWMFRLRGAHQINETLKDWKRTRVVIIKAPLMVNLKKKKNTLDFRV